MRTICGRHSCMVEGIEAQMNLELASLAGSRDMFAPGCVDGKWHESGSIQCCCMKMVLDDGHGQHHLAIGKDADVVAIKS